jgi:hypothetical protein
MPNKQSLTPANPVNRDQLRNISSLEPSKLGTWVTKQKHRNRTDPIYAQLSKVSKGGMTHRCFHQNLCQCKWGLREFLLWGPHDTQHNDIQHTNTQQISTQHTDPNHNDIQHKMLHLVWCHYADFHLESFMLMYISLYAECPYPKCRYAECHCAFARIHLLKNHFELDSFIISLEPENLGNALLSKVAKVNKGGMTHRHFHQNICQC